MAVRRAGGFGAVLAAAFAGEDVGCFGGGVEALVLEGEEADVDLRGLGGDGEDEVEGKGEGREGVGGDVMEAL